MHKIACNSQAQAAGSQGTGAAAQLPLSLTQVGIVAAATAAVVAPFRSLQQLSLPLIANIANFYLNIAVAAAAADVVAINQLLVKHLPRPLTTLQPTSHLSLPLSLPFAFSFALLVFARVFLSCD